MRWLKNLFRHKKTIRVHWSPNPDDMGMKAYNSPDEIEQLERAMEKKNEMD